MLRLRDRLRRRAEASIAEIGFRDANAVRVPRRQARSARESDEERIQIGAFAAERLRFEHEPDVADAAAARLRIAKGISDDPLVDRARFVHVAVRAARDREGGRPDDAVGRDQLRGPAKVGELRSVGERRAASAQIH